MEFKPARFTRSGTIHCKAAIEELFPLLCPKKEEEWIPGWECETIWSTSGYNEEGAVFRTQKPYGTELYWTTLEYNKESRRVDFLISAPRLYMFRFKIHLEELSKDLFSLTFTQTFTAVSEDGNTLIRQYQNEDYDGRLQNLAGLLDRYLEGTATK